MCIYIYIYIYMCVCVCVCVLCDEQKCRINCAKNTHNDYITYYQIYLPKLHENIVNLYTLNLF